MLKDHREGLAIWLLFGAALVIHLAIVVPGAFGPVFTDDELAYFANARLIAGVGPEPVLLEIGYYHAGYSLMIAPLYLIFTEPGQVYAATIVLNCVLGAAMIFPLAHLGRHLFDLSGSRSRWLAFAATLYPGTLLISHFAFADNVFSVAFLALIVLSYQVVRQPSLFRMCLLAVMPAVMFLIHPRALPLLLLVPGFLVVTVFFKPNGRKLVATALPVAAAAFVAVWAINNALATALYPMATGRAQGLVEAFANDPDRALNILPTAGGQIWYLTVASLALVPLGVGEFWKRLRETGSSIRDWLMSENCAVIVFLLVAAATLFAVSVVFMSGGRRIDHHIYGRYNDGFASIFVIAGLAGLFARLRWTRLVGTLATLLVAWSLVGLGSLDEAANSGAHFCSPCVAGLTPFLSLDGSLHLGLASTAVIALLGVLLIGSTTRPQTVLVMLLSLFVMGSWLGVTKVFRPFRASLASVATMHSSILSLGLDEPISYDMDVATPYGLRTYQFWLPRTELTLFSGATGPPPTAAFISSKGSPRADGARLVAAERNIDQALWMLPGATFDAFETAGLLAPADLCGGMPVEAYAADLSIESTVPLVLAPGESTTLPVSLLKSGGGSPWLPMGSIGAGCAPSGVVRLGARWSPDADPESVLSVHLADFSQVVHEGDQVEVPLTVSADMASAPLAPGRYLLRVSLVHQGVAWFDELDPSSRLDVEVVVEEQSGVRSAESQ